METVLRILNAAGGWHPGLYLRIENPPYIALVIEAADKSGPCGLPALSVAHYGSQNGDAMRDPEMCFELGQAAEPYLDPFYWRNDWVGIEQWSRCITGSQHFIHTALHKQHREFARLWDRNLHHQGFAEAFERQQHQLRP